MKRLFLVLVMLGFFSANAQVVVKIKPHQPKVVIHKPSKHKKGFVWVAGHWEWNKRKGRYAWKKAHWKRLRKGFRYAPGYWAVTPGGFKWIPGHWNRR